MGLFVICNLCREMDTANISGFVVGQGANGWGIHFRSCLFLNQPLVLAAVKKNVAAVQLATFHAGITGQIVDLAALSIELVRATPSASCHL